MHESNWWLGIILIKLLILYYPKLSHFLNDYMNIYQNIIPKILFLKIFPIKKYFLIMP